MTNQEAIKILGQYDVSALHFYTTEGEEIPLAEWSDAIEAAISALQAQDFNQLATDCVSRQAPPDALEKCYTCKHVYQRVNGADTLFYRCRRGCKYEEFKPKRSNGNSQ